MTTKEQIQEAYRIAETLKHIKGIESAVVDDWDDDGNFSILLRLKRKTIIGQQYYLDADLMRITNAIKQFAVAHNFKIDFIEHPKPMYRSTRHCGHRYNYYIGHDGGFTKISIRV